MTIMQCGPKGVFSPEEIDPEHVVVSHLLYRIYNLPKEALADLLQVGADLTECRGKDEVRAVVETMKEILFPEVIGSVSDYVPEERPSALVSYANWVGSRIKAQREAKGITQEELGQKTGLTQSHISRLEGGMHSPAKRTLERIADALSVNVKEFDFDDTDE